MAPLLPNSEVARVRREHSILDVLGRLSIGSPERWNGSADFMLSCPCPSHDDSIPSCVIHPRTDGWRCFGCGARGGVFELGVIAFTRKGCLDLPADPVIPIPVAGVLAEQIAAAHTAEPAAESSPVLPAVLRRLATLALDVPSEAATQRFAAAEGRALVRLSDGMGEAGCVGQVLNAVQERRAIAEVMARRRDERYV
jgi:hypothetical protein